MSAPPTPPLDLARAEKRYERVLNPIPDGLKRRKGRGGDGSNLEQLLETAKRSLIEAKKDVLKSGGLLLPKVSAAYHEKPTLLSR